MRFVIERTSHRGRVDPDRPPVAEAVLETVILTQRIANEERVSGGYWRNWYADPDADNYRLEPANGRTILVRDKPAQAWVIHLETLEELLRLHEAYGEDVVLTDPLLGFGTAQDVAGAIEIYDDYRE